jgi:predicted MFS family arabinose efflux permease
MVTVIWTILIVRYGEPAKRGNDFGLFSMATGLIAVAGPPIGLAAVGVMGLGNLGLIAGAISTLGAAAALYVLREPEAVPATPLWELVVSTWRWMVKPIVIFASVMCGFAVLNSFLPPWSSQSAARALLLLGIGSACSRFIAGRLTDRFRPYSLLVPGLAVSACGMSLVSVGVADSSELLVLSGSLAFGSGVGTLIVSSYLTLIWRTPDHTHPALASFWNAMFDSGLMVGGIVFSPIAALYGYPWMFVGSAVLLVIVFSIFAGRSVHERTYATAPSNAPVVAVLHGDIPCQEHPLDP